MGMLTKEDLGQIGQLFDQKFDQKFDAAFDRKFAVVKTELVEALGEVIDQNITPQFDDIRTEMREGFDRLERRIDRVDGKVNTLTNVLLDKNVITDADKQRVLS